jgi:hypothetical protein
MPKTLTHSFQLISSSYSETESISRPGSTTAQNLAIKKKNLQGWRKPGVPLRELLATGFQSLLTSFGEDRCHFPTKPQPMTDDIHQDDVLIANHAMISNTTVRGNKNQHFMVVERGEGRLPNVKSLLYVNPQFNGALCEEVTAERVEKYEEAVRGHVKGDQCNSPEDFATVMLEKVTYKLSISSNSSNPVIIET